MKYFLVILLLTSSFAFSQSNYHVGTTFKHLTGINYLQLRNMVELDAQLLKLENLKLELLEAQKNGKIVKGEMGRLKVQNVELRKLMDSYLQEIEKLKEQ